MSNHWDLRCLSCAAFAGFDMNHGRDMLQTAWEHREAIAALAPLAESGALTDIHIGYPMGGGGGGLQFIVFCVDHKDHDVRTVDEYGTVLPDVKE